MARRTRTRSESDLGELDSEVVDKLLEELGENPNVLGQFPKVPIAFKKGSNEGGTGSSDSSSSDSSSDESREELCKTGSGEPRTRAQNPRSRDPSRESVQPKTVVVHTGRPEAEMMEVTLDDTTAEEVLNNTTGRERPSGAHADSGGKPSQLRFTIVVTERIISEILEGAVHPKTRGVQCTICGFVATCEGRLKVHVRQHFTNHICGCGESRQAKTPGKTRQQSNPGEQPGATSREEPVPRIREPTEARATTPVHMPPPNAGVKLPLDRKEERRIRREERRLRRRALRRPTPAETTTPTAKPEERPLPTRP